MTRPVVECSAVLTRPVIRRALMLTRPTMFWSVHRAVFSWTAWTGPVMFWIIGHF